jgi:hypothetical protein
MTAMNPAAAFARQNGERTLLRSKPSRASSSSFWAAQHDADKSRTGLGMMDRQRLKMWLRDAYQQIDTAPV